MLAGLTHNPYQRGDSSFTYGKKLAGTAGIDVVKSLIWDEVEIEARKEEADKARYARDPHRADGDDFFIEYTDIRSNSLPQGVVEATAILEADKSGHSISGANTTMESEEESLAKADNGNEEESTEPPASSIKARKVKNGLELSWEQIQALLEQYGLAALKPQEVAGFLSMMTMSGPIEDGAHVSPGADTAVANQEQKAQLAAYIEAYNDMIKAQDPEEGSRATLKQRDLVQLRALHQQIQSLQTAITDR